MCTHAPTSHVLSFETITSHKTRTHSHAYCCTVMDRPLPLCIGTNRLKGRGTGQLDFSSLIRRQHSHLSDVWPAPFLKFIGWLPEQGAEGPCVLKRPVQTVNQVENIRYRAQHVPWCRERSKNKNKPKSLAASDCNHQCEWGRRPGGVSLRAKTKRKKSKKKIPLSRFSTCQCPPYR